MMTGKYASHFGVDLNAAGAPPLWCPCEGCDVGMIGFGAAAGTFTTATFQLIASITADYGRVFFAHPSQLTFNGSSYAGALTGLIDVRGLAAFGLRLITVQGSAARADVHMYAE